MLGRTISHYRISSQLGAGGMGVVYAGEDVRLGRSVALKFVPDDLGKDPQAVERLRGEARAASALNHPSICTIYDVGEFEGRPFIVMELLRGQTLRDALNAGPLKIHQVVDIGIQVADALEAAHESSIVHRDIKPANLFLVDRGGVKILDFGLAKQVQSQDPTGSMALTAPDLTVEGLTVGTVSYMSPEQVTGDQLDGRTDLFSLGIVLYECVTGHRPFTGKTSAAILAAILNNAHMAPSVFNPQLPSRLQDAINNCLEKDRELRYQNAAGLRADLKRIRRDLESGQSHAVPTAATTLRSDSRTTPRSNQPDRTAAADDSPARRTGPRWLKPWGAAVLAASAIVAATSYWFWFRPPPPQLSAGIEVKTSDTLARNPLGLATDSLNAKDYREALRHAQDALRLAPDNAEAGRVIDEARAAIGRLDEAIARGNRLADSGDLDKASAALNVARDIDPRAADVTALSERILAQYKVQALKRQRPDQLVVIERVPQGSKGSDDQRVSQRPFPPAPIPNLPPSAAASPNPAPTPPAPSPSATAPPAAPRPTASDTTSSVPVPETAPVSPPPAPPAAAEPAPSRAEIPRPNRSVDAPARPRVEDDDTVIRRVVATWVNAIENKNMPMYRSVKPNLSAEEQRRIEEGFNAVSSQKIAITILGIEHRDQEAVVRLRRRDTLEAGGRQQTRDSQQTLTLIRAGTGWVISEIGR